MISLASSIAGAVARTNRPFGQAAMEVMRARHIGVRGLARETGLSAGYLSRVLREVDGKRASPELIKRIAEALELPEDYFLEARRARADTRCCSPPNRMELGARPARDSLRLIGSANFLAE